METSFRRVGPGVILPVAPTGPGGTERRRIGRLEALLSEAFASSDDDQQKGQGWSGSGADGVVQDRASLPSNAPHFEAVLDDTGHAVILANRQATEFSPSFSADLALIAHRAYAPPAGRAPSPIDLPGAVLNQNS